MYDSLKGKTLVLGIGAQKSGTTWFHNYLSRSPEIYCARIKEMHFFDTVQSGPLRKKYKNKFGALLNRAALKLNHLDDLGMESELRDRCRMFSDPSRYWEFFAARIGDKRFFCDVTPSYANIGVEGFRFVKNFADDAGVRVKLFFVMRDPIERSRSAIAMKHGKHHGSIVPELAKEQFVNRSRYDLIIENVRQVFSANEFQVLFYEHVFSNPDEHLKRLMDFLDVPYHRPDTDWRPTKARAAAPLDPSELQAGFGAFEPTYAYVSREFPEKPQTWYY